MKIEKDYMQEEGLPSKLIKVTNAALVIRKKRNPPRRAVQELGSGRQVKNFKKFRKVHVCFFLIFIHHSIVH